MKPFTREAHREAMRRAIELAGLARGDVEPNPKVGAVCLRDGQIVGEGYHRAYGRPHAEREALADAAKRGESVDTVCVTLEPCSTKKGTGGKKTPPCTDGLIEAGVKRCVIAMPDPDPRHCGTGVKALREAGIEVIEGFLHEQAAELNRPFRRWLQSDTPWTIAKVAQSLDGKIATHSGHSRWITQQSSRYDVHRLRARCDAIVVGYRTALADDPRLTVREVEEPVIREGGPLRIVVDPRAELPTHLHLYAEASSQATLAIVREDADPTRVDALRSLGVDVLEAGAQGDRGIDLRSMWRALRERGLKRVMVEGGGGLLGALLASDLIDQWRAYIAPILLGGSGAPSPVAGPGFEQVGDAPWFEDTYVQPYTPDLRLDTFRSEHRRGDFD